MLRDKKVTSAILTMNIGSDAKAIKRAIDELKKVVIKIVCFTIHI